MIDWEEPPNCPQLPSVTAACQLRAGDPRGLPRVAWATVSRAAMIGTGLVLAGERDPKTVVKYSVSAALVIEAWVLWRVGK